MKIKYIFFLTLIFAFFISGCVYFNMLDYKDWADKTNTDIDPFIETVIVLSGDMKLQGRVVTFLNDLEMGKYVVTYLQWYKVYQWALNHGYSFANYGTEGNNGCSSCIFQSPDSKAI